MVKINPSEFSQFSYSKRSHFAKFEKFEPRHSGDIETFDLKVYQDLLVYNFLISNVKEGARVLEVGGGESRVIEALKNRYELWNLDKLEGFGWGPVEVSGEKGFRIVRDYIGNFNSALPESSFDCVFSISALEHVPEETKWFEDIILDIDRLLKPGGFSLHCFDVIWRKDGVWSNELMYFMYGKAPILNPLVSWSEVVADPDLYIKSKEAYERLWQPLTNQTYEEFGKPFSYNVLWQKPSAASSPSASGVGSQTDTVRLMKSSQDYPRITIVTPSFNQGEFLEECIDSVLSQEYPNLEYIVMDGGSTDKSVDIIKKFEKHLAYWQSKPDQGQYHAINEGFKRGTGDIMAWLNSDDKYHARSLVKVASVFHERKEVEWIAGRPTAWSSDGKLAMVEPELISWTREKMLSRQASDPFIQQESTFWRRSLWKKAGSALRTDIRLAADLELWVRFSRHAQLFSVDALLGGYRYQKDQKARILRNEYFVEVESILQHERLQPEKDITKFGDAPAPIRISEDMDSIAGRSAGWTAEQTIRSLSELSARQLVELRKKELLIGELRTSVDERSQVIDRLHNTIIKELKETAEKRAQVIHDVNAQLLEKDSEIQNLKSIAEERSWVIHQINEELETIKKHWAYRSAAKAKRILESIGILRK